MVVQRYAIIGAPRTGSSHLVSLLNSHPSIHCHNELFHPKRPQVFIGKLDWKTYGSVTEDEWRAKREEDPFAFLDYCYSITNKKPVVGFKIFHNHNDDILHHVLRAPDIKIIVLHRQNFLAVHSSALIAEKEQVWGLIKGEKTEKPREQTKVTFEESEFRKRYDIHQKHFWRCFNILNQVDKPYCLIGYEQLNEPMMVDALRVYLGLREQIVFKSQFIKQNSRSLLERFDNPDIVEAFLARHSLMHWLYEGQTNLGLIGE